MYQPNRMEKSIVFPQEFLNGILNFGSLCQDSAWFQGVLQIDAEAMVDVSSQICVSVKVEKSQVIVETRDPWKIQVFKTLNSVFVQITKAI